MKKPSPLTLAFSVLGAGIVLFILAPLVKMLLAGGEQ
jgi:hypothetical protein